MWKYQGFSVSASGEDGASGFQRIMAYGSGKEGR